MTSKFNVCHNNIKLALFLLAVLSACKKNDDADLAPTTIKHVKTLEVNKSQEKINYFSGIIQANNTLEMTFRVQGEVVKLPIKSGRPVDKGQLLAQLDNSQQLINKKSAEANLKKAKAEFERAQSLIGKGAISQAELDNLDAQYIGAQASYEQSVKELEYTYLYAPFKGFVSQRHIDNFTQISSSTAILTLLDNQQYKVIITVPQSVVVEYKKADKVEFSAEIEGYQQSYPLIRDEFSFSKDSSQQYKLTLLMQPPKDILVLPGMSVRVKVTGTNSQTSVILPSHSVLEDETGHYVYLTKQSSKNYIIEKRNVTVTGVSKRGVVISRGLNSGERVVIAGISQIFDGQEVIVGETK